MTIRLDRRLFLALGAIVAVAAVFAVGVWVGRPAAPAAPSAAVPTAAAIVPIAGTSAPGAPVAPAATIDLGADATRAAEPRIEVAEAAKMLGRPDSLFVDVRAPNNYLLGHIEGAINVPEYEITTRQAELPKDKDIILYCA